jgi:tRNA(Ile2) C34 agmatinyltransferase TiaS
MLRCPECGGSMKERILITKLGDIDGWNCISCDSFYDRKEIKKAILTP